MIVAPEHTTWRFLITPPAHGAWNMAVDEAVLLSAGSGASPPTLRLYTWEPPCISLGYAQSNSDIDINRLTQLGWDIVRRPTGGRAILHTDELTYSVVGPSNEPRLAGSVLESYRHISKALLTALHQLGASAIADPQPNLPMGADPKGAICFEVPSNYEITVDGKKLIGSAQARRREGVLQHGSMPLFGDLSRITWVLAYEQEEQRLLAANRILQRATTLEAACGYVPGWQTLQDSFKTAFEKTLNLTLVPSRLTDSESRLVGELLKTKYNSADWNVRI